MRAPLKIAIVGRLGGAEPLVNDLASGLARRGHRVRLYPPEAYERVFRRVRADNPDVVSQHAFDAEAIELSAGLPVLHTLHMPPIVPGVVRACLESGASFVAVSDFVATQWRAAGLERVQTIRNGVPDFTPLPAVVKPVALCSEKAIASGLRAAQRAGLRVQMLDGVPPRELSQLMAGSAVCLLPVEGDEPVALLAAQAQVAGCPVAGYARGALTEIVEHGVSGVLAPPGDGAALAAAVRRARALDRRQVRASGRARLLIAPVIGRYEAELAALAERQRPRRAPVFELSIDH